MAAVPMAGLLLRVVLIAGAVLIAGSGLFGSGPMAGMGVPAAWAQSDKAESGAGQAAPSASSHTTPDPATAAPSESGSIKSESIETGPTETSAAQGEPVLEFCLILPGLAEPGLAEAVGDLAAYLESVLGRPVQGRLLGPPLEDNLDPALAWIAEHEPAFGLVGTSFYIQYARTLGMTPLAASRPGGFETDQWRLMVRPEDKDKPLSGLLRGTMLFPSRAGACLLLAGTSGGLVRLEGAVQPLEALRRLLDGQGAGVALDRLQYQAMHNLAQFRDLVEVHATQELPMPPLVWFGKLPKEREDHVSQAVAQAFQAMAGDPEARTVLRALGIQSFGPPDPALAELLKACRE